MCTMVDSYILIYVWYAYLMITIFQGHSQPENLIKFMCHSHTLQPNSHCTCIPAFSNFWWTASAWILLDTVACLSSDTHKNHLVPSHHCMLTCIHSWQWYLSLQCGCGQDGWNTSCIRASVNHSGFAVLSWADLANTNVRTADSVSQQACWITLTARKIIFDVHPASLKINCKSFVFKSNFPRGLACLGQTQLPYMHNLHPTHGNQSIKLLSVLIVIPNQLEAWLHLSKCCSQILISCQGNITTLDHIYFTSH